MTAWPWEPETDRLRVRPGRLPGPKAAWSLGSDTVDTRCYHAGGPMAAAQLRGLISSPLDAGPVRPWSLLVRLSSHDASRVRAVIGRRNTLQSASAMVTWPRPRVRSCARRPGSQGARRLAWLLQRRRTAQPPTYRKHAAYAS